jgi:predicted transcriptional regulator
LVVQTCAIGRGEPGFFFLYWGDTNQRHENGGLYIDSIGLLCVICRRRLTASLQHLRRDRTDAMADTETQDAERIWREELLRMTTEVASAYVSNNSLAASQLSEIIRTIHESLVSVSRATAPAVADPPTPAVPIRKSVTPDYIVCLEDGKKLKMLERHLRSTYNMTPEEYRARWNLPPDYPMVAPNYAAQRSEFAKKIGLGRSPGSAGRRGRGRRAGASARV